ncbi:MAG: YhcH/YjgK/YiaL family protein [Verrucomicrobia bacterium]|jgi:YhcH/YjgK/YiaL family protein|nr:YhcH/YjgK/YiaL family protein [Verrucomicrobiota bacterium]
MMLGRLSQLGMVSFLRSVPAFRQALDFIAELPPDPVEGITEILGRDIYMNVHSYPTKARLDCSWESHRHTTDIQLCLSGGEHIDWTPCSPTLSPISYAADRDFEKWQPETEAEETITLAPGRFAIYLPGELHRPMISNGRDCRIKKIAVKIHTNLLEHRL